MNIYSQFMVYLFLFVFSFGARARLDVAKKKATTPAEIVAEANAAISRALASQFGSVTEAQFNSYVVERVRACPKAHKECLDVSKWIKTSCQTGFETQLNALYNIWNAIAGETKTEAEGRAIWSAIQGCSKRPSAVQTAVGILVAKVYHLKGWNRLLDGTIWPWLKTNLRTRPNPPEFAIPFLIRLVAEAEKARPAPFTVFGDLAAQTVKWPPVPAGAKLEPGTVATWIKSISRALFLSTKSSLIPGFVESHQASFGPADATENSEIVTLYCDAVRRIGQSGRCELFIAHRFAKTAHPDFENERALGKFESGDLEGARTLLPPALANARKIKSSESRLQLTSALVATYQGRHEDALKALTAAAYPGQGAAEEVMMNSMKVSVLRRMGNAAAAQKLVDEQRGVVDSLATGPYYPAVMLEYEAMLLALQTKALPGLKIAVKNLKSRMSDDKSLEFYKDTVAAAEKKMAKQPIKTELARLSKLRGAANPYVKDFEELVGKLTPQPK